MYRRRVRATLRVARARLSLSLSLSLPRVRLYSFAVCVRNILDTLFGFVFSLMSNHYPSSSGEKLARTTAEITKMPERKKGARGRGGHAMPPEVAGRDASLFFARGAEARAGNGREESEGKLTSNAISLEGPFLFSVFFSLLPFSFFPPPRENPAEGKPIRFALRVTLLCTKQKLRNVTTTYRIGR